MSQLTKAELKTRLLSIVENLPSREELSTNLFDFNLDVIDDGQQLLTDQAKKQLIAQIKSSKTTKQQLRRAFVLLSGLTKIAIMFA